ncbi:E3 ubiquitin-protein ligase UPL5-like [Papaver somniferum]|nr:E3 ubiquitin-protein ligase UPL5-like [Papaver somniferum]
MERDATGRVLNGNNQSGSCSSSDSTKYVVGSSSSKSLHFFVRNSNTNVIHANEDDTIESVHEQIRKKTKIPLPEQGCIYYRGKKLEMDKTLEYYSIQKDAQLQLVARVRSTKHPKAWKIVNKLVSTIGCLCRGERRSTGANKIVFDDVQLFINMSSKLNDGASTFSHNQIFVSGGAAASLVTLFVSPVTGNKECAEEAIQLFLHPLTSDTVTTELQTHYISIILEFCKLLSENTSKDNPLYTSCRNTLGKMLEILQLVHGDKGTVVIQGLSLFVSELGRKVIKGLDSCINPQQIAVMSLSDDVRNFIAFLTPLCSGLGMMNLLPICLSDLLPCYVMELGTLHVVFLEMLGKMDKCLEELEISVAQTTGKIHILRSGWGQYLFILKALNTLSKIYKGAEENVLSVLRSRQVAINALILHSRRSDDHRWILEHKDLTTSESRRHLTMMLLPEVKDDGRMFEMLIDRKRLLAESFEYISKSDVKKLLGGRLFMEFKNELATGPGVLREWFCAVCQAVCNPQNALFVACPDDSRRFFPNAASDVNSLHLKYFQFFGRVIALSLVYKVQVGILFDRTFFLQLAGKTVSLEDVRDADPLFYSSCKKILEMDTELLDSDALGLTFVREIEKLGSRTTEVLRPGGDSIALNSKNRKEYINLLIHHRFVKSVQYQVTSFAKGFSEILSGTSLLEFFFRSLEHEDLDRMLHGSDRAICVEDWKAHTEYNGCKKTDNHINWFWKNVEGMSDEQRRVLLFFWTAVKYLPAEGFGGLQSRLFIHKSLNSPKRLPSAHTCFYQLCLPRYRSKATMQKSLQIITQEHVSCSFGMG